MQFQCQVSLTWARGLKISLLLLSLCRLCTESRRLACLRQRTPFDLIMSFNRAGHIFNIIKVIPRY